jgi:outer membrane protein assembly factor BamD
MKRRLVCMLVAALVAAGCGGKKALVPPEKLWGDADQAFQDEAWEYAVDRYKMFLDQNPFDQRAEEAELRVALSYYHAQRYPEAIAAFGDFERMHPTSPNLAMVEYHLGMSYLSQASTSDRDQQPYANALTYFRNVIDRFPRSPHADKAKLRTRECRESLAKHEADVAAYYLRHGNILAAESRLRRLLTEYPETDATAQALLAFARTYASRDEPEGVTLTLATLVRHHPDGPLAREARDHLGGGPDPTAGQDPLPLLVTRIDRMRATEDRKKAPPSISAYPEIGGVNSGY